MGSGTLAQHEVPWPTAGRALMEKRVSCLPLGHRDSLGGGGSELVTERQDMRPWRTGHAALEGGSDAAHVAAVRRVRSDLGLSGGRRSRMVLVSTDRQAGSPRAAPGTGARTYACLSLPGVALTPH